MQSRTKPWNLQPQELPTDIPEIPVFDYENADRTVSCGLKFKTKPPGHSDCFYGSTLIEVFSQLQNGNAGVGGPAEVRTR